MDLVYLYKVHSLIRVVDGDTIDAVLAIGFGLTGSFRFRVALVDTPEVFGPLSVPAGKAATIFTTNWLRDRNDRLLVRTFKGSQATVGIGDGHFGRWLADFHTPEGEHLAQALIEAGHGR